MLALRLGDLADLHDDRGRILVDLQDALVLGVLVLFDGNRHSHVLLSLTAKGLLRSGHTPNPVRSPGVSRPFPLSH
ncbi:hypothetical protein GCM10009661_48050 [Catellatospora chokoriensis]